MTATTWIWTVITLGELAGFLALGLTLVPLAKATKRKH